MRTVLMLAVLFSFQGAIAQQKGIGQFSWLAGNWESVSEDGKLQEQWKKKDDNSYSGVGYFILNHGDTVLKETLHIVNFAGHWCYVAVINDNKPVMFVLGESDGGKWVFENSEHDFPQRVVYSKGENNTLVAWIEGTVNGESKKETYVMKKVR